MIKGHLVLELIASILVILVMMMLMMNKEIIHYNYLPHGEIQNFQESKTNYLMMKMNI